MVCYQPVTILFPVPKGWAKIMQKKNSMPPFLCFLWSRSINCKKICIILQRRHPVLWQNIFEKYIWNTSIRCPTNRAKATHLITINVKNKYKFPKRNISLNWIIQLSCIHFTILLIILFCIIVVNIEKNLRHRRPQTACVSSVWLSKY